MAKIKVKSSNILTLDYKIKKEQLIVEFTSKAKYKYDKVPLDVYEEFLKAESKGKYFAKFVKDKFEFEKIKVKK